mgnify:FL=1
MLFRSRRVQAVDAPEEGPELLWGLWRSCSTPLQAVLEASAVLTTTLVVTRRCSHSAVQMVSYAYPPLDISPSTFRNSSSFLRIIILFVIAAAAVAAREFAVVRFESIIHECVGYG